VTEKVLIFPEPGNTKAIAKQLLALADKALDVEFVSWPQEGFRVPEALAMKFTEKWDNQESAPQVQESETPTELEAPVKRKPGRPKKEAQ
jgi:hypothetical protein